MVLIAMTALGAAGLLASTTGAAGATAFNVLTLNFTGAAASVVGHMLVNFLATPIFYGCLALLVPGLILAFVLPMVPYAVWLGGVLGWFILVCEAVVAFPMWAFAHLTLQGDGLHGRGIRGYELLCNLLFRPILMLFGLFLGYVIFAAISWLLMQSFGIAAGFVLANGWLVTNLLGVVVLLCMFVLMELVVAVQCFRMISLVPHHAIGLMAIQPANRVDMDQFAKDAGIVGLASALGRMEGAGNAAVTNIREATTKQLQAPQRALPPPTSDAATDSTLNAATDVTPPAQQEEPAEENA
jgi:conjugal transfer/type IV secretion protein DotA/TraY